MAPPTFDHEKLDVYRNSIAFCAWVGEFLPSITAKTSAKDQLDRASTSVPLNIAEGNGKFTAADRCRFFDTARACALRCAACLDVLVVSKMISQTDSDLGKNLLHGILSMLVGLIRSNAPDRFPVQASKRQGS